MIPNATNLSTSEMAAARRRRQARMRFINVPMRRLLQLPFATPISRRLMLLHFTGRKTGRAYRQPVSYVPDGDTLLTPGGGNWKRNLREGEPVRVRLRGRDREARPQFIRDPAEVERLLNKMMAGNPRLTSFVPFIGPDRRIDQAGLSVAVARGFCVVRWHLDPTTPEQQTAP
jgi:deazaflavin-dependent oxidoreductase (nitroreductase family)